MSIRIRARLIDDQVIAMREAYQTGTETLTEIGARHGVSASTARAAIGGGTSYNHIPIREGTKVPPKRIDIHDDMVEWMHSLADRPEPRAYTGLRAKLYERNQERRHA